MFTTLSKRLTILFLALLSAGFVCAEEWMKSGLHCGQIVVLTATPEPDYRFSGWSDGNTDNPRRVEVTKAMELQALFVSACEAQYILPVDFLFSQMYVLNRNRLKEIGYTPQAVEVRWYRVVGEIDNVTASGGDDVLVTTGYYLSRDGLPGGQYYAQCNFPNQPSVLCFAYGTDRCRGCKSAFDTYRFRQRTVVNAHGYARYRACHRLCLRYERTTPLACCVRCNGNDVVCSTSCRRLLPRSRQDFPT